jgi:hypothetical protein
MFTQKHCSSSNVSILADALRCSTQKSSRIQISSNAVLKRILTKSLRRLKHNRLQRYAGSNSDVLCDHGSKGPSTRNAAQWKNVSAKKGVKKARPQPTKLFLLRNLVAGKNFVVKA